MSKRAMLTVALGLFVSAPAAFAGGQAQPQSDYRVIKMVPVNPAMKKPAPVARPVATTAVQPIAAPAAQPVATRLSSTASAATSNLPGGSFVAAAPARAAIAYPAAPSPAKVIRAAAPLVVATADDVTPVINDRAAVDNNARLMGNSTYAPATVTQDQAMAALAAEGVEPFSGEVPEQYAGEYAQSADCGYYSRSCYRPSYGYGGYYRSSYYCAPRYYAPAYSYYRPAYYGGYYGGGYCGPRYYGGSYYGGYYRGNGYYVGGYYGSGYGGYGGFTYGYSNRCGSSWGISIGF